jgi:predicted Zn-dependent protease
MRLILLLLLVGMSSADAGSPANWSANYPPCKRHSELLQQGHMDLGVRVATANQVLAEQFRHAMDTWASILDLDWHEDESENCSIQLVDGERQLFQPAAVAARSQLPDRLFFDGWIAFNPGQTLSAIELYHISLHEIGHVLGLQHSSNAKSVMYSFNLEDQEWLDLSDLAALAQHHKLRIATPHKPVKLTWTRSPQ